MAAFLLSCILLGCGSNKAEIALITDVGTVDDGSYNQGCWEGIVKYGDENGINYKYYQPKEALCKSYLETIKDAVRYGAKIIVCPGYLPEEAVFYAQDKYPNVHFILVDGIVHNSDYTDFTIKDNVMPIRFAEEQAGFLAGYAAVKDGYNRLGFMGGEAEDAVIRFGYGFVQGADYAAIEMGKQVEIRYYYTGTYFEDPYVSAFASDWYNAGTEVIFACGGAMGRSVMHAAEASGGKVIGVDVDQSSESKTVITSALKNLSSAVYSGISDHYQGNFKGGAIAEFNASNNGIGLVIDNAQFRQFNNADYNVIYTQMLSGAIVPYNVTTDGTCNDMMLVNTSVIYQENTSEQTE